MYTITLEVNQICNFNCRYCYLGEKAGNIMDIETAIKALDIAILNAKHHRDRRLWVDYVGGEALINFNFLKNISEYIERKVKEKNISVTYSLTTNGSIMNSEILAWLIDKKVHIKLSIDGAEEVHNRNRILKNGYGSYETVKENLLYFKQYENKTGLRIQGAHVVTKNNYAEVFSSVKHLVEQLGFDVIDSSFDLTCCWSEEELQTIAKEWDEIVRYYIYRLSIKKPFLWGTLIDIQKCGREKCDGYLCGVGMTRIYVRTNGEIYGCAANLSDTGLLGNVEFGINTKLIRMHQQISLNGIVCSKCKVNKNCSIRGCIMNRLNHNGDASMPNPVMCFFEKTRMKLWNDYHEVLELYL